jgi:hypothetical protein
LEEYEGSDEDDDDDDDDGDAKFQGRHWKLGSLR